MSLITYRDSILRAAPAWLQRAWGSRLLYGLAIQWDALTDATVLAVKLRLPQYAIADAVPLIGRERGIRRGFDESAEGYAARLVRWVDDRRIKGNPFALLAQLKGYFAGYSGDMHVVNVYGMWHTLKADGTKWSYFGDNWNWDGDTEAFSRYWVIIDNPTNDVTSAPLWTVDGTWDSGGTWGDDPTHGWGLSITLDQVDSLQGIVADWNSPHEKPVNIIVNFEPTAFDPEAPYDMHNNGQPHGSWGEWHVTIYDYSIRSRYDMARYLDGTVKGATEDTHPYSYIGV